MLYILVADLKKRGEEEKHPLVHLQTYYLTVDVPFFCFAQAGIEISLRFLVYTN